MTVAPLKEFKKAATKAEQQQLADAVGTTAAYLFNQLGIHREFTFDKAASVEFATIEIARDNGGKTPIITRDQLVAACSKCPFALAHRCAVGGA